MSSTTLHVRAETKPLEHRSAVTPTIAKKLVDAGYTVNIERSPLSIFPDSEYNGTGASLVPTGSWIDVPSEHIIIGLKELPEEDFPLKHTARTRLLSLKWQHAADCRSTSNLRTVRPRSFLQWTILTAYHRLQRPRRMATSAFSIFAWPGHST